MKIRPKSLPYEAIRQAVFHPHDCTHPTTELRRKIFADGIPHYHIQCLVCGQSTQKRISKRKVDESALIPLWDEELARGVWEKFNRDWEQAKYSVDHVSDGEWWAQYNEYLESPQWALIREAVLKRDHYVCQGCGSQKATEVHHLTYEHVREEFLFELVSVCSSCHDRLHSRTHSQDS